MDKKTIDTICWWIPFRKLRDAVRDSIYELYYKADKIIIQNIRSEVRTKLSYMTRNLVKKKTENKEL